MAVKRRVISHLWGKKKAALHLLLHKDTFDLFYGVQSALRVSFFSQTRFDGEKEGRASAKAEGPPAPTCTLSLLRTAPTCPETTHLLTEREL